VHEFARQMANFVYLVGDRRSGECAVVDGAWDPKGIVEVARSDGMNVTLHIATHYHWDHIGASEKQGVRIPGLRDWVDPHAQGSDLGSPHAPLPAFVPQWEVAAAAAQVGVDEALLTPLSDGQCMALGRFGLEFIHTPGHSPGSMCIRVSDRLRDGAALAAAAAGAGGGGGGGGKVAGESEYNNATTTTTEGEGEDDGEGGAEETGGDDSAALPPPPPPPPPSDLLLITGDTVFPGSCGRLDLPDSDPLVMYDSLRKIAALPDGLPIYPGHSYSGASSTIGREKASGLLRPSITREQWKRMMVR
jgi:glyoxylase-like metal-dependent hydrolase (beta-lactamase superfamily II)